MSKLEEQLEKLISDNNELREKYYNLLRENEELKKEISFKYLSMMEGHELLDKYCDFDLLINTMKKQDIKIRELKLVLKRVLLYFEKLDLDGVSEEEEILLKNDIKNLLESKNEKSE